MHELSLALEICRLAEETIGSEQCPRLVTVAVDVGADAWVEPDNLLFCLDALLAQPPFAGARPILRRSAGDDLRLDYLEVDDGRPDD